MIDQNEFITRMQDVLEIEDRNLSAQDQFRDLPEWTSLAYLSTIAMIDDEYGVIIPASDFRDLRTIGDIAQAIDRLKQ